MLCYVDVAPSDRFEGALLTHPVLLEAILRAEEAVLDAELQAAWALQGSGIVRAVNAETLLLGRRFHGHDGFK